MKRLVHSALQSFGFDIVRHEPPSVRTLGLPTDISSADRAVLEKIHAFTMTSVDRQIALVHAVRYLARQGIDGSFVECGVWRGGSSMAMALALLQEQQNDREIHLFDTFEGMTAPTSVDQTMDGVLAQTHLERDLNKASVWCVADLEDVKSNMASTGYPSTRIHFHKGPVEVTVPAQMPEGPIALLRLDTDWYESTRHELVHFYPRLCQGGVLIIDDYGHWAGARKAVDEYFGNAQRAPYLHRIDYTGRLLIKH